jgi:hypothetical protein
VRSYSVGASLLAGFIHSLANLSQLAASFIPVPPVMLIVSLSLPSLLLEELAKPRGKVKRPRRGRTKSRPRFFFPAEIKPRIVSLRI